MPFNAKELIEEMLKHKHDWREHGEKYITIMDEYVKNHDIKQIRQIMSGGDMKINNSLDGMQMDEMHDSFNTLRTLLSIIVPNLTSMICVTFSIESYNFAYVYFVIDSDGVKPLFFSVGENLLSADGEWRTYMADIGSYELLVGRYAKHIELIWDAIPAKKEITTNLFYSHELPQHVSMKFQKFIDEQQYGIRLLALAWFSGKYGSVQKHAASEFTTLLEGQMPDIPKTDAVCMFKLLGSVCGCIYKDHSLPIGDLVKTGQKLILLSPDEVSHPLDESFDVWNELITLRKTSDLVLNIITPCFAIHSAWFFVYNANNELFNTPSVHKKIEMSDTIRMTPDDMRHDKVVSNVAICIINENAGLTFLNDMPIENTGRYVFDIIFALYCMNTKLGKMHGDLHGNNVVMTQRSKCDGYIIYAIGTDEYIFPHTGKYSCVIDFSRVIDVDNIKIIEIAIRKYEIYFSEWMKLNYDTIMKKATDALSDNMEQFIKIATAFDMYEFSSSILSRTVNNIDGDLKELLEKIKSETTIILLSIISDNKKIEWANYILIKNLFSPAEKRPDIQKIWGYYSHNNNMTYSTDKFKNLPSLISLAPMIADDNDSPVTTNGYNATIISAKYRLMESEENILRGVGL
jgi:hypothetical protein